MRLIRNVSWAFFPLAVAFDIAAAQIGDAAAPVNRAPERCILIERVRRTEVIDDRTLIFHMRSGEIYLNYLERECPRLAAEKRFMYSPTANRLCDNDTITVLERWGFDAFSRGFTCGLGEFHPISELELAELKQMRGDDAPRPARRSRGEFEVVPVDPDELAEDDAEPHESAADEASGSGGDGATASDREGDE